MTLEQLKQFCSTDKTWYNLLHPWTEGEWSFATDGKQIVMVPKIDGAVAPEGTDTPNGSAFLPDASLCPEWVSLSECPRGAEINCNYCRVECAECDGEGYTGDYDCAACESRGWVLSTEPCDQCHGTRKIMGYQCGVALIDPWLIRNLPLQSLEFIPRTERRKGVLFRFDGGYAFVMPIWKED